MDWWTIATWRKHYILKSTNNAMFWARFHNQSNRMSASLNDHLTMCPTPTHVENKYKLKSTQTVCYVSLVKSTGGWFNWWFHYFILLCWRSEEWKIQDDMEISQASVCLSSLSAAKFPVPRSSTPPISLRLWGWKLKTVSPKLTHMAWVMHTAACLSDRWSLQSERGPDWMQYTGLLQAIPLCVPKTTLPWCKCEAANLFLWLCSYLWVTVQRLQVELRPVTLSCIIVNPVFSLNFHVALQKP